MGVIEDEALKARAVENQTDNGTDRQLSVQTRMTGGQEAGRGGANRDAERKNVKGRQRARNPSSSTKTGMRGEGGGKGSARGQTAWTPQSSRT